MKRTALCLGRKRLESIEIGDVTVTVVRIGPSSVRLMIEADRSVLIRRTEVEPIELGAVRTLGNRLPVIGTEES